MSRRAMQLASAILALGACALLPGRVGAESAQKLTCSIEPSPLKLNRESPSPPGHDLDCEGFLREGYYRIEFEIDALPRRGDFTVRIFDMAGGRNALIEEIEAARFRRALKAPLCDNGKRCLLSRRIFATSGTREDERIVPQFRLELAARSPVRAPALTVARVFAYVDPPDSSEMRAEGILSPPRHLWLYFAAKSIASLNYPSFKAMADATVLVMLQDGGQSCSGVLVAPSRVLTNYHCFRKYADGTETIPGIVNGCSNEVSVVFWKHGREAPAAATARCVEVLPLGERNRALDYAVIKIGPIERISDKARVAEPRPVRFSEGRLSAKAMLNGLSHDDGRPLRLAEGCEAEPEPSPEALKSQLAALGIPHNAASIRHLCSTTGGGSGSPLFAIDPTTGEARLQGLHHSGYLGGKLESSPEASDCFRDWFSEEFAAKGWEAKYWNFAYDAHAIRCALDADRGVLDAAAGSGCRRSDIPTTNNFNPNHPLRKKWLDYLKERCGS